MASKAISSCKSRLVGNIIYDILRYQHVNPYHIIIKFFLHLSMWDEVAGWITQSQDPKADIGMQCNALLPNLSSFKKLFSTDHKQLWSYMKDILYLYEEETRIKVKIWLELKGVPEGVHEGWGHISPYIPCLVFIRIQCNVHFLGNWMKIKCEDEYIQRWVMTTVVSCSVYCMAWIKLVSVHRLTMHPRWGPKDRGVAQIGAPRGVH